jgi:hypothetical protein
MVGVPDVSGEPVFEEAFVERIAMMLPAWLHYSTDASQRRAVVRAVMAQVTKAHDRRVSELLAANNREVEKRRAIETELVRQRISNALLQDDHDKHYARAEALSLELRRLRDGQPDGHQRPRQQGLASSEPVVGD